MNKIDKIFKWVSIILLLLILIPIAGFTILFFWAEKYSFLIHIVFTIAILCAILILIGYLTLIILFFIKLFSKNKTKKTWLQIILNLICIIFYSYISFFCVLLLLLFFVSDGINS